MDSTREPRHGYADVNRRNIDHLRDERDRAGLHQLADVLATRDHPDAATLSREARAAADWIDATTPRLLDAGDAHGIRLGDILRYTHHGHHREGIIIYLAPDGRTATTNLGDTIAT